MLSLTGYLMVAVILILLLTSRVAAVVALAGVPILAALIAGFDPGEVSGFVADGLRGVAPTATMFVFAIVYFGIMRDAGFFDPIINRIVRWAGTAPATIAMATTALAIVTHLDGAGATTFIITIPAMLPLYDRLGMSRLTLAVCTGLGAGVMNLMPWGGPTARAAAVLEVDSNTLWTPLIPAQIVGVIAALGIAYFLGRREQARLSRHDSAESEESFEHRALELSDEDRTLRRPKLFWFNALLTLVVLVVLVLGITSPELAFLAAVIIALIVNYPGLKVQTARIEAHAVGAMLMATTLLAAGAFLGIIDGSGMIEAMAASAAEVVPASAAPGLPLYVGILGVPLSLLFGPDAYYFGVMPVLVALGAEYGVPAEAIAQASMLGQETVGFPISPMTGSFYLLVGLAGVDIGKHIRALFGWAWLVSLIMLAAAAIMGVIPLWVR